MIRQQKQKGYTLVELAIVLVIMSTLAGGIAIGRELIESAKTKSLISDFESLKQAHFLYVKRTGFAPGVYRDASENMSSGEWDSFSGSYFDDLIAEGLIVKTDLGSARMHSYDGEWIASSFKQKDAYINGPQICARDVPIWVAEEVDAKLDDGVPSTGRVLTGAILNSTLTGSYEEESDNLDDSFTVCLAL